MKQTKSDILTEEALSKYKVDPRTIHYLEEYFERSKFEKSEISVLDWGCGRGRAVLSLRKHGYNAFGVEIDPKPIERAMPLFKELGHDHECLSLLSPTCRTKHQDNFFHFTISDQVFEHVRDIDSVAGELYRVMAPGAEGLHIYPAPRKFMERHLLMPLVHWLPKNALRKAFIGFYVLIGREPRWKELDGSSVAAKTNRYYEYSINCTYYRSFRQMRQVFEKCGFDVESVILDHPKLHKSKILSWLSSAAPTRPIFEYVLSTFRRVELYIQKPECGSASDTSGDN